MRFSAIFESKVTLIAITDVFAELFRTKSLRTAEIIAIFRDFGYFEIKPEMWDVLVKMREKIAGRLTPMDKIRQNTGGVSPAVNIG